MPQYGTVFTATSRALPSCCGGLWGAVGRPHAHSKATRINLLRRGRRERREIVFRPEVGGSMGYPRTAFRKRQPGLLHQHHQHHPPSRSQREQTPGRDPGGRALIPTRGSPGSAEASAASLGFPGAPARGCGLRCCVSTLRCAFGGRLSANRAITDLGDLGGKRELLNYHRI